MKNWIYIYILSFMILAACSDGAGSSTNEEEPVKTVPTEAVVAEPSQEETKVEPKVVELKPLTLEDFNNRYELDTEYSEPFIDGKFELIDGSIVYADWYFYLEGETFEYATGTFIDGQLVDAQLELKEGVSKEDVLTELGLTNEEVSYEFNEMTNVVDVIIDERFGDDNIRRLPNEWE